MLQVLREVGLFEFFKLEGSRILVSDVIKVGEAVDVVDQMQQLLILRIVVEGNDRNPVV